MRRALPPVGVHRTDEQVEQSTTDCEWLNTVVIWKHPAHFTSMKKELGDCTNRLRLCWRSTHAAGGCKRSISCERTWGEGAGVGCGEWGVEKGGGGRKGGGFHLRAAVRVGP